VTIARHSAQQHDPPHRSAAAIMRWLCSHLCSGDTQASHWTALRSRFRGSGAAPCREGSRAASLRRRQEEGRQVRGQRRPQWVLPPAHWDGGQHSDCLALCPSAQRERSVIAGAQQQLGSLPRLAGRACVAVGEGGCGGGAPSSRNSRSRRRTQ
jgi:hypothetical protein